MNLSWIRVFTVAVLVTGPFTMTLLAAEDAKSASEADTEEPRTEVREQILVTANRLEDSPQRVGSSVTVITAEEIESKRKNSVAELLRTVPGVEVVRGGGPGQVTSVFIRGGNSSHTLVLLDGVRLNSTTTGAFDFANLSADAIERIEIVRGPQSTLYGSEAVAGVISLFSKSGREGLHFSGLAEAGELGSSRFRARVDGGTERFDYSVSVSDEQTDGVSSARERAGNTEDDPYDVTTAAAHLGFGFGDDGEVDVDLRYFDAEVAIDGFDFSTGGPVDDLNRIQTREGFTASLRVAKQLAMRWKQTFVLGLNDEELAGSDPDDVFSNFGVESRSLELTSQSDLTLGDSDTLTLGFSYEERDGGSVGSFDENVDIFSVFVQNAWSWEDRFSLTAGIRNDDHSQFGDETTFRLSSSWSFAGGTRLHGTFGTGFKAPTLNDLFFPFFSNPDLVPETSESFDFGVEQVWGADRWRFDITYFDTDFEDLIAFSFVTFTPENISEATSSGVEVTLGFKPNSKFRLVASHTVTDTEDLTTGLQLARRPENRSTLDVFFEPLPRLTGSASLIVASDRIDSDGSAMDDYERLDLSVAYQLRQGFEPYLRIENLFDDEYEEINGFTTPGTVATVGVSLRY